ncbi:photosystem II reaction center protein T [Okeania sp. KiyG1]|nr:photosystem II reaction center protein T [Okeania sp. KiyG1]
MESAAYILVLALALGVIFFAIAFRDPPELESN